jgi:hypothetical protein
MIWRSGDFMILHLGFDIRIFRPSLRLCALAGGKSVKSVAKS